MKQNHNKTFKFTDQNICLIGYGRFGEFFCKEVLPNKNLSVYTRHPEGKQFPPEITVYDNLQRAVKNADIIIPAVPIGKFKEVIIGIAGYLKASAIFMDVCSVKNYPVEIMKTYLPPAVQIIASHPLFGPKYFEKKSTLAGSRMVMWNISADKNIYSDLVQFFRSLSIEIIEINEQEHDKLTAQSQFFTHLVRYFAQEQGLHKTKIDTTAADLLFDSFKCIGTNDQLLKDMIKYNPFCREVLNSSIKTLTELQKTKL